MPCSPKQMQVSKDLPYSSCPTSSIPCLFHGVFSAPQLFLRLHEMLGLPSATPNDDDEEGTSSNSHNHSHSHSHNHSGSGSVSRSRSRSHSSNSRSSRDELLANMCLRELLMKCAEAVSVGECARARSLLLALSERSSPDGDAAERVAAHFAASLAVRLARIARVSGGAAEAAPPSLEESQEAYLALNKITPFIRFCHLTANQAILEALEGCDSIHIVDFEIMQGVQWPPLMQALAERTGGPPSRLRITGTGADMEVLEQTGNRLIKFAISLGLPFEFHALHGNTIEDVLPSMLDPRPGEALAVNFVLQLHRLLLEEDDSSLPSSSSLIVSYLSMIRSLHPKMVVVAERELSSHTQPLFMERFTEALSHYSALFESLDASLPPGSPERTKVEHLCFRPEIMNIVLATDCAGRHQKFSAAWYRLLHSVGFNLSPPSSFALSQARLLLRLHYPSEGYQIQEENRCLLLGWQNTPLFAVSSWY